MVKHSTNTNAYELQRPAHYALQFSSVTKKQITSKKTGNLLTIYEWVFYILDCDKETESTEIKLGLFKTAMGDLLRAFGAKEEPVGNFPEWDDEDFKGKQIECDLIHSAGNDGVLREVLIEIKPLKGIVKTKEEKAWDE